MTGTLTDVEPQAGSEQNEIRPFKVNVSDADLTELRRRVKATRWPEKELVNDASQGVQLATIQKLARFWADDYDWRKVEARLNAVPNFITEIDGLDIHFIHVKSREKNALPLIVTHGWPGSVIEQLKIIGPLTNPTAHGGKAEDAFDLVIPSLPGYGFSGKPTTTGWDPPRIARAWTTLMKRLGYTKFVAQGGDWGALITELMGQQAPPELLGIHTNMPGAVPPDIHKAALAGAPAALRSLGRRTKGVRPTGPLLYEGTGVRPRDGEPAANALRNCRFTRRPGGVDTRPRLAQLRDAGALHRRKARGHHADRRSRQHHALLVDEHRRSPRLDSIGRTSSFSSLPRTSPSRSRSAPFQTSSIRPRGVGLSEPIPN